MLLFYFQAASVFFMRKDYHSDLAETKLNLIACNEIRISNWLGPVTYWIKFPTGTYIKPTDFIFRAGKCASFGSLCYFMFNWIFKGIVS